MTLSILLGDHRPDLIREETLADFFRQSASQFGERIAYTFQGQEYTYRALDEWSDQIALYIQSNGIGLGSYVGVWWKRSAELPAIILGIVKSGATYIPLDIEMPEDRVEVVMTEIGAKAIFTHQHLDIDIERLSCPFYNKGHQVYDQLTSAPTPSSIAYIIYTSGSTGKPKGIPIEHRQICHLIRAENTILQVSENDIVYQGFSVSFDMWCEEVWVSWMHGAKLFVADAETAKSVDELSTVLRRENITVLHAVPSLLAVIDANCPKIRLVNAGGEACTAKVLEKWADPSRQFFNSYGPTETTVSATFGELKRGDKIHIGKPLPNYNLAVINEKNEILPLGEKGEMIISGPCLSPGYIQRPELTREKFLDMPEPMKDILPGNRIYRTGDAVIFTEDKQVNFQGRIDDQVKLRGYRIELDEIMNGLAALEHVVSAAVAVHKDMYDQDALVGYVVLQDSKFSEQFQKTAKAALSLNMPAYMIPSVIVELSVMPRLPSGKVNKKALEIPSSFLLKNQKNKSEISSEASIGEKVMHLLKEIFQLEEISPDADFFKDLGGHSLLAAVFVSRLREELHVQNASLKDIYTHKKIADIIGVWESKNTKSENPAFSANHKMEYHLNSNWRYYSCWMIQSFCLLIIYGLFAVTMFSPFLIYYYVQVETETHINASLAAFLSFFIIPPVVNFFNTFLKWLIIGKYKEGDYPLWGSYYIRWWFIRTIQRLNPVELLSGTPLYNFYLKSYGMRVSSDAQISQVMVGAEDLVEIGENVSISSYVVFDNAIVVGGLLKLRKIKIGNHVALGTNTVIGSDTVMEDWSELKDLSYLPPHSKVKMGEIWSGSPAMKVAQAEPASMQVPEAIPRLRWYAYIVMYSIMMITFPIQFLAPLIPAIYVFNELDNAAPDYNFEYLVIAPVVAMVYLFLYVVFSSFLIRLLQWNLKEGKYPIFTFTYVRKWLSDQIFTLCLGVLHPIFASVYISSFYRLLGAKVGKRSEISTASNVTHCMLEIGDEAFIADAVALGESDVRNNIMTLQKTKVGNTSFVGNSALIPQGYTVADNTLIGVLSIPPSEKQLAENPKSDWFGSPAIALPNRQDSGTYDKKLLYYPNLSKRIARGIIEFIRIILPQSVIFAGTTLFVAYAHDLVSKEPIINTITQLPFYYLFFIGIPALVVSIVFKWLVIGKYTKENLPMWSFRVWRSEAVTTTYEALAIPFLLDYLRGTPWLPFILRFYGVRVGEKVYLNTSDITEFDLVSIGNEAELNEDCGPQTHLFEDRVMKIGSVDFGVRSNIGTRTIVLYDTNIGDDVHIMPLSLVMKGETLGSNSVWMGSPIEKVGN